ncbi:MAG: toll/interleukin-1 receptor domain-containing protein [Bacteroidota bacterium]
MKYSDLDIYLSYSWKQTKEANLLEQELFEKWGIILRRDRKELTYKDSITNFMQELAGSEHIILLLSNEYFESEPCMHEFVSILNNDSFSDKILPIRIDNVNLEIYSSEDRLEQVLKWQKKLERFNEIKDIMQNDYKKLSDISDGIGNALFKLSEMNTLSFSDLSKSRFQVIVDDISKKYTEEFETPKYLISINPFDSVNLYQPKRKGPIPFKSLPTVTKVTFYLRLETDEDGEYLWINHDGKPKTTQILKPLCKDDSYNGHVFDFSEYGFLFEISFRHSAPFEISIKSRINLNLAPAPTPSR